MEQKNEVLNMFKSFLKIITELIKTTAFIVLIFLIARLFFIQPFIVNGSSMEPNFHDKEYLLIDKISYRFTAPKRGDVVIFHPPNRPSVFFIKRIIGLPGEKVVIDNGTIFIYNKNYPNGVALDEPYLESSEKTLGNLSQTLKDDEYFVLGDNRNNSTDSREFGVLPKKNIAGRVFITIFPFSDFGLIKRVEYPNLSLFSFPPSARFRFNYSFPLDTLKPS